MAGAILPPPLSSPAMVPSALRLFPFTCMVVPRTNHSVPAARRLYAPPLQERRIRAFSSSNATPGDAGAGAELHLDFLSAARKVLDGMPQPVKDFPWMRMLKAFGNLAFVLALTVAKYLSVPLLALTSLSEMSYCGHEKRMWFIPIPFLLGLAVAGILNRAALDSSPELKEQKQPWHLIVIGAFFLLLKLPGPYLPYLGRLCIPHFANGGLWRAAFLTFSWARTNNIAAAVVTAPDIVQSDCSDEARKRNEGR